MCSLTKIFLTEFNQQCVFVIFHLMCFVAVGNSHGFTYKYLDKDNKVLRLQCDGAIFVPEHVVKFISIYNGTSKITVAQMLVGECPTVGDSTGTNNVYTLACVAQQRDPLPVLKVILTDMGISSRNTFGCNITKLDKSGTLSYTTWTIDVDKIGPDATSARTAESQLTPKDKSVAFVDSYLPLYAMGFAILSLGIGLAAALFYIGMYKLKNSRSPLNMTAMERSGRSNGNTDAYSEAVSDSGDGPDVGCERSLMCPANGFRRPSHQDYYSEPLSPTLSGISDYVGIDFMQVQLSNTLTIGPALRLSRNNSGNTSVNCGSLLWEYRIEELTEVEGKGDVCNNMSGEFYKCPLDSAVVVVESTTPIRQACGEENVAKCVRNVISQRDNMNRGINPQRA